MKIILSPAKSMNAERPIPDYAYSSIVFEEEALRINKLLRGKSAGSLGKLMHISDALASLNADRNQQFSFPFTDENARPAVFYFDGDVYQGLDVETLQAQYYDRLQDQVRILSGLYGLLRPMDRIQAYRLEMGTKFPIGSKKNLVAFWKPKLTAFLNAELESDEWVVNLASNEYFSALDAKAIKGQFLQPQFKDYKNGTLKMISFFAKKARGMMTRYLIENECTTRDEILSFDGGGYHFSETHTEDPTKPVFIR
jgi:cytoplasmic iron level regulating protein YaaA (DUF328/UPF0246 family)